MHNFCPTKSMQVSIFTNFLFPISLLVFRWRLPHSAALLRKRPSRRNFYSLICGEFQLSRVYGKPHFILKKKSTHSVNTVTEYLSMSLLPVSAWSVCLKHAANVSQNMQLTMFIINGLKRHLKHVARLLTINR